MGASTGSTASGQPAAPAQAGPERLEGIVLVHASTRPEDATAAVGAAGRLIAALPRVRVRVVNGPALDGLLGSDALEVASGVIVEACEFGMEQRGIAAKDLQGGVATVPAAIAVLAEAQLTGAAYIRI